MNEIEKVLSDVQIPDVSAPFGKTFSSKEDFEAARADMIALLEEHQYGVMPKKPLHLSVEVVEENKNYCAGKAIFTEYLLRAECEGGTVSFPFYSAIPKSQKKSPVFLHINFRNNIPDRYQPTEEIIDRGYAVFTLFYKDVTPDDGDFRGNNARILVGSRKRGNAPGKIAMWAWAGMRIIDYIMTRDELDTEHIAVIGHSRLGKTTLLLSAYDERVKYACSNGAGTCGDAVIRTGKGERFADIIGAFEYWFCPNFRNYADNEDALPHDQHYLIALSAPRRVYIGAAKEDLWADPRSQFLGLYLTRPIYALYGLECLPEQTEFPKAHSRLSAHCAYHHRFGTHYLSREDWNIFMDNIDKTL